MKYSVVFMRTDLENIVNESVNISVSSPKYKNEFCFCLFRMSDFM